MAQALGQATLMDNKVGEEAPCQAHNLDITARALTRELLVGANGTLVLKIIGTDQTRVGETNGHEMVVDMVDTQDNNNVCHSLLLEKAEAWEASEEEWVATVVV